nr:hypothetical protein [Evansella caseinilytica]
MVLVALCLFELLKYSKNDRVFLTRFFSAKNPLLRDCNGFCQKKCRRRASADKKNIFCSVFKRRCLKKIQTASFSTMTFMECGNSGVEQRQPMNSLKAAPHPPPNHRQLQMHPSLAAV